MEAEGDRFGPYTIRERLGAGGMATVHRATLEIGGGLVREVALKRLLPQLASDRRFIDDFVREAKLAAQLQHPNIVRILELGQIDATYFIAMELVAGASLASLMQRAYTQKQPAPIGVVIALLGEICDALEYATNGLDLIGQKFRIVHRDLTPSNLIVGDDGRLKVIDFGVAKATTGKFMTNTGLVKGKLGYMPFETVSGGDIDARADVFSAGVVAWELLTGRRLFRGANEYEVICKIRDGATTLPSEHNPRCPRELDDAVMRALAKHRDDRWPSALAFRRALDEIRRYYRDAASPRDVIAWVASLGDDPRAARTRSRDRVRPPSEDGEPTRVRASELDLARVPEGSSRDIPRQVGRAASPSPAPRFVAADTTVDPTPPGERADSERRRERGDTQPEPLDDDVS